MAGRSWARAGLQASYGEAIPALKPPGLQDQPPAFGFHTRPKAVHPLPVADFGLPCSFRHTTPSPVRFAVGNYTRLFASLQMLLPRWSLGLGFHLHLLLPCAGEPFTQLVPQVV
jgi:hypothetical protein